MQINYPIYFGLSLYLRKGVQTFEMLEMHLLIICSINLGYFPGFLHKTKSVFRK